MVEELCRSFKNVGHYDQFTRRTHCPEEWLGRKWTEHEKDIVRDFDADLPAWCVPLSRWLGAEEFEQAPRKRARSAPRPNSLLNDMLKDFYASGDPDPIVRARHELGEVDEAYAHELGEMCDRLPDFGHPMSGAVALVYAAVCKDRVAARSVMRKMLAMSMVGRVKKTLIS
jgi:hypothetical protein